MIRKTKEQYFSLRSGIIYDRLLFKMNPILFFTPELSPPVQNKLAGVYDAARERGWTIRPIAMNRSGRRPGDFIRLWSPAGLIVECAAANPFENEKPPRLPTVWLDRDPAARGGLAVNLDVAVSAELAANELLAAKPSALAFVGWHSEVWWSKIRRERLARIAKSRALPFYSAPAGCWSPATYAGEDAGLRDFLASLPPRAGVFAANDLVAERVIAAASLLGRAIPGELFLIGADNDLFLDENSNPTLSSVVPDFHRIGELSVEILERRFADGGLKTARLSAPPKGVNRRESTRAETILDARLAKAVELIRREATNGLAVPAVAAAMGCSRRMAELRFREVLGRSILDEIHEVRLARALELLARPDQAIEPIANLCGWQSPVSLKRLFNARFGMTMREWRQNRH